MKTVYACDMSALTGPQRTRHHELAAVLRPAITAAEEIDDGYALRFETTPEGIMTLAEFVTLERLCCPWLTLAVEVGRNAGPLRLRITADAEAKPSIRAEFGIANTEPMPGTAG